MTDRKILYIGNDFSGFSNYSTSQDVLSKKLRSEGFEVKTVSRFRNYIARMIDISWAIVWHKKQGIILIDVFSTKYFYLVVLATWIARLLGKKYITILRGGDLPIRLRKSKKQSQKVFHNALCNVAPSGYLKHEFEKEGYATKLIPNILDIGLYTCNIPSKLQPNILWVRSFRNLYNPIMAIETIRILKNKFPNVQLCMIGPFKDDSIDQVKNAIQEYQLEDHVEITGGLAKKDWITKSKEYDFFINTTSIDNTPVSVMEAMALGKVVVSTNVGGIPYLLDDINTAYLVDNNDSAAMAQIIEEVITDNNTFVAENARKQAELFDWEHVKKQWFEILS